MAVGKGSDGVVSCVSVCVSSRAWSITHEATKCSHCNSHGRVDVTARDSTTDVGTQADSHRPGLVQKSVQQAT
jgi:hypothetical protein